MSELNNETVLANKTPQNISPDVASMMINFNRNNSLTPSPTSSTISTSGLNSRQNLLNSSTNSTSSVSSQQVSKRKKFSFIEWV